MDTRNLNTSYFCRLFHVLIFNNKKKCAELFSKLITISFFLVLFQSSSKMATKISVQFSSSSMKEWLFGSGSTPRLQEVAWMILCCVWSAFHRHFAIKTCCNANFVKTPNLPSIFQVARLDVPHPMQHQASNVSLLGKSNSIGRASSLIDGLTYCTSHAASCRKRLYSETDTEASSRQAPTLKFLGTANSLAVFDSSHAHACLLNSTAHFRAFQGFSSFWNKTRFGSLQLLLTAYITYFFGRRGGAPTTFFTIITFPSCHLHNSAPTTFFTIIVFPLRRFCNSAPATFSPL